MKNLSLFKNLISSFIVLFIILFAACSKDDNDSNDVLVNKENFPDENFRNYITEQDYGSDKQLSYKEIAKITEINVRDKNISDLTGIEHFTALTKLECFGNRLTSLNISKNTMLTNLNCEDNKLTSLDISKNTMLNVLICINNYIPQNQLPQKPTTAENWVTLPQYEQNN